MLLGDFLRSLLAARIAIGVSKSAPPGRKTAAIQNEAVRRDLMGGFSHSDCTWYVRWITVKPIADVPKLDKLCPLLLTEKYFLLLFKLSIRKNTLFAQVIELDQFFV